MVQNIFNIDEKEDRILNIIKAKHGLKNKNQALQLVLQIYHDSFLEPALRPEFIKEMKKIEKEKGIRFNNVEELQRHIEKNA